MKGMEVSWSHNTAASQSYTAYKIHVPLTEHILPSHMCHCPLWRPASRLCWYQWHSAHRTQNCLVPWWVNHHTPPSSQSCNQFPWWWYERRRDDSKRPWNGCWQRETACVWACWKREWHITTKKWRHWGKINCMWRKNVVKMKGTGIGGSHVDERYSSKMCVNCSTELHIFSFYRSNKLSCLTSLT